MGHALERRAYRNDLRPRSGLEVLDLAQLRRRLPAQSFRAPHRLEFHQITLFTRGSGSATVDFTEHRCGRGTLLHVRPGQVHRLPAGASRATELQGPVILFTPPYLGALRGVTRLVDLSMGATRFSLTRTEGETFARAMADLAVEYERHETDELSTELLRQLVRALLLRIIRLSVPTDEALLGSRSSLFRRFRSELEESFTTTRNAQEYAARLGCSLKTLTRSCQRATDHTAKELIDARVVLEAKRLLVHTDLPAAEVATLLDFSEATNFAKFFARAADQTPGQFRASQREER